MLQYDKFYCHVCNDRDEKCQLCAEPANFTLTEMESEDGTRFWTDTPYYNVNGIIGKYVGYRSFLQCIKACIASTIYHLDPRSGKREVFYLATWQNFPIEECTWEREVDDHLTSFMLVIMLLQANFTDANMIREFEAAHPELAHRTSKPVHIISQVRICP